MGNYPSTSNSVNIEYSCKFCQLTNHKTEYHICGICKEVGIHSAKDCTVKRCSKCGKTGHTIEDHTCQRQYCVDITPHVHTCIYCFEDHTTENHECRLCRDKGHSIEDHWINTYCEECKVKGHHKSDKHVECNHCNYVYICSTHFWCGKCNMCSILEHLSQTCQYCDGCLVDGSYDLTTDIFCSKCYKRPDDVGRYDISKCIRVPKNSN